MHSQGIYPRLSHSLHKTVSRQLPHLSLSGSFLNELAFVSSDKMAEQCYFTFHGDEETDGPRTVDGGNRDENGGDTSGLSHRDVILRPGREELLDMKEKSGQGKIELLPNRIPLIERNIELMTGYSVELVDDGSLRLGLLCVCCNKIARDAMQTSIGHRICEPCAERIKKYICVHACLYACVCTN